MVFRRKLIKNGKLHVNTFPSEIRNTIPEKELRNYDFRQRNFGLWEKQLKGKPQVRERLRSSTETYTKLLKGL